MWISPWQQPLGARKDPKDALCNLNRQAMEASSSSSSTMAALDSLMMLLILVRKLASCQMQLPVGVSTRLQALCIMTRGII